VVDSDARPFSPLLREIFDRMPAGIAVFDRELRVVEWNASFSRFLEDHRPELAKSLAPGAPLADVSPWDVVAVEPLFRRALAGDTVTRDAAPHSGPNGATYWDIVLSPLYENGEIVGVLDTTTEATRRIQVAREAAEREELFRLVFDSTSDAVILNDFETGDVADANPAAASMHGYTREEFVGIDPRKFIHPDSLPLLAQYQDRVRAGLDFRSRARDIRKDGTIFDVEVMGSAIEWRGKKYLAAVVRDISDQVAAEKDRQRAAQALADAHDTLEQRVAERTRELESVLDVSRAILSTLDLDEIFERVMDELIKALPYSGCSLTILEGDALEVIAARGLVRPELSSRAIGVRFPVGGSPEFWGTMLDGKPLIVSDTHSDERAAVAFKTFIGAHPVVNVAEIRSWLFVPMVHQGEVIGTLSISRAEPHAFEASHAALASTFAGQVAIAVANARLYQQTMRRAREMEGLASIAGALTFDMPSEEVLTVLSGRVLAASSAVACSFSLYDERNEFRAAGAAGLPRSFVDGMVHAITIHGAPSITQATAHRGQRQVLRDTRRRTLADPRFEHVHEYLRDAPWDTAVITPVIARGKALGTLDAYYPGDREPDAEELRLLAAIADQVAIGIENAELFAKERQRAHEMDALYRAEEHLHQSLVLDDVLQALADSALHVVGVDRAAALVFEEAPPHAFRLGGVAGVDAGGRQRLVDALAGMSTEGPRMLSAPRVSPNAAEDTGVAQDVIRAAGVASTIDVPITIGGKRFGLFSIGWVERHYITESEIRLANALAQRAAVAIENARLFERSQLAASLEERQRLARELHDSVSQALYGISLGTRTARTLIERNPAAAIEPLDYVGTLAEAGLAELRALIFELRPESLAMEGLVAALEKQLAAVRARHGVEVRADLGLEPDLRLELKEVLYRVGQEALHNTVKHARATSVEVTISRDAGTVRLRIQDDGIGFDTHREFPGHLGLRSMAERTARVGGKLTVQSTPGSGTTITLDVPDEPGHLPGGAPI
jgi:PAS domain S-box-containing protein